MEEIETMFIICSSNQDCRDYDGCTNDYCNLENKLCNNTQTECANCTFISLDVIPDNVSDALISILKFTTKTQNFM